MPLRFSDDGPELPDGLIDDLLRGDAVFLCGAGVSLPQLPGFRQLALDIFGELDVPPSAAEQAAINGGRFEEALGSLARRLADPSAMTAKAAELLRVPDRPDLANHRTVLRLSRSIDNRIAVVTTNFDTLLERAVPDVLPGRSMGEFSFAGQALPAPGTNDFGGVIHLHGRLADARAELDATSLVLTSSDYGDAYMRSGWASRFLFDLARCRSIVLLGYRAGDAPVRYFLNVLEADRARFTDLRLVYAFDSFDDDPHQTEKNWGTLGVTVLPYRIQFGNEGERSHHALWRDLSSLADMVERQKPWRRERTRAILSGVLDNTGDGDRRTVRWLIGGRQDLWADLIDVVVDPAWFGWIEQEKLWIRDDAVRVVAAWIAKDFGDWLRIGLAADWHVRLGDPLFNELRVRLGTADGLDPAVAHAWLLLFQSRPDGADFEAPDMYFMQNRLDGPVVLASDLETAVGLLSPRLRVSRSLARLMDEEVGRVDPVRKLSDVVYARVEVGDDHGASELMEKLIGLDGRAVDLLDIGTAALAGTLRLQRDLDEIGTGYDANDYAVPSVEEHDQNEHHDGPRFLVGTVVRSFPAAVAADRARARAVAKAWPTMPGRLGARMLLHVMREPAAFGPDEALDALLSLSRDDFWSIERETALLVRDRAGNASSEVVAKLRERICGEAADYYAQFDHPGDNSDWRRHARDKAIWLYLKMLQQAGRLDAEGLAELEAITARRDYLRRDIEDQDFFGSYAYGVTSVVGDSDALIEAEPDDRLGVALELRRSPDLERRQGWPAYCRIDPQGAFDTLAAAAADAGNASLWSDFLASLVLRQEDDQGLRAGLVVRSLRHLADAGPDVVERIAPDVADILSFGPNEGIEDRWTWWDRAWAVVVAREEEKEEEDPEDRGDIFSAAINSAVGRLVQPALSGFDAARQAGGDVASPQQRLRTAVRAGGRAGRLSRLVVARAAAFLLTADKELFEQELLPRLRSDDAEGTVLRQVALSRSSITPSLCRVMPDVVARGAIECRGNAHGARVVVSHVLRAAIAVMRQDPVDWGLPAAECSRVLRSCSDDVRSAAVSVVRQWLHSDQLEVGDAWREVYGPFFARIWPKERALQSAGAATELVAIASGVGDEFPGAYRQLKPFIVPAEGARGSVSAMLKADVIAKFPHVSLDVLWQVCGPPGRTLFYDIAKSLDAITEADRELELDRRYQWLEQRAPRY